MTVHCSNKHVKSTTGTLVKPACFFCIVELLAQGHLTGGLHLHKILEHIVLFSAAIKLFELQNC